LFEYIEFPNNYFEDNRWNDFKRTFDIRNRLMHPKTNTNLNINNEEMIVIVNGWKWWIDLQVSIIKNYRKFNFENGIRKNIL
jgi:hypothetical protein